jgi:transcriptional regulator with XRE-family HTH domain
VSDECTAIIDRLIEERRRKGISQRQLARNAQLPQSVVARLETKKVTPQLDTLIKVANALECNLTIIPVEAIY